MAALMVITREIFTTVLCADCPRLANAKPITRSMQDAMFWFQVNGCLVYSEVNIYIYILLLDIVLNLIRTIYNDSKR